MMPSFCHRNRFYVSIVLGLHNMQEAIHEGPKKCYRHQCEPNFNRFKKVALLENGYLAKGKDIKVANETKQWYLKLTRQVEASHRIPGNRSEEFNLMQDTTQ